MKKHQTAKHRKQRKKEVANRKAKQINPWKEQARKLEEHLFPEQKPAPSPMSPARKAFQNL